MRHLWDQITSTIIFSIMYALQVEWRVIAMETFVTSDVMIGTCISVLANRKELCKASVTPIVMMFYVMQHFSQSRLFYHPSFSWWEKNGRPAVIMVSFQEMLAATRTLFSHLWRDVNHDLAISTDTCYYRGTIWRDAPPCHCSALYLGSALSFHLFLVFFNTLSLPCHALLLTWPIPCPFSTAPAAAQIISLFYTC